MRFLATIAVSLILAGAATACPSGYYRNVDGICVMRPTPLRVTPIPSFCPRPMWVRCCDGLISCGTKDGCSRHGGVCGG